ncbi:MAG: hypothetical protein MJ246_00815 [Clostridia bacterium]|nr:hypothetical protein [Clostridia bacterium]
MGKKVTNNVGKTLVNASKQYDKTGTTVAAKRVHNAGMILQGNVRGLRTERDRLDAIKKRNKIGAEKKLRKTEAQLIKEIETEMPLRGNVNSDRMYMKAREGTLTQDEIDNLRREGGLSAKIADYASTRNEIKENEKEMKALGQQIDSLGGLSALQGSVSKETLANLKAQSGEANNNVAEIYEHTLDEFDRLEDKMYKTIEKIEDPSTSSEDRTKEQANLKTILEQVIDKAQIISEVSVELNMTGGAERMEKIRNAQSSAVREKANRFDKELKTEAMDSIQATQDNLETLENREKNGENAPKIVTKKSE